MAAHRGMVAVFPKGQAMSVIDARERFATKDVDVEGVTAEAASNTGWAALFILGFIILAVTAPKPRKKRAA